MTFANWTIVIAIGLAVIYPLVMRLLMEAVQPQRLEMADLGRELLHAGNLSEHHKKLVRSLVDDAFEWRFMMFVFFVMPVFAWLRFRKRPLSNPFRAIPDCVTREKMGHLVELYAVSAAAANPVFSIFVAVEFFIFLCLLRLVRGIDGGTDQVRNAAQRIILRAEERMKHAA